MIHATGIGSTSWKEQGSNPLAIEAKPREAIVNLRAKLERIHEYWKPKIAGELNDSYVKLVKLKGEFVWHHHEAEDELFLVVKGRLLLRLRDREVWVNEGEFAIVPKGVEHLPIAREEVHVVLIEPKSTLNTGNVRNERTVEKLDRI